MADNIHLRCNECQHWLAGPLTRSGGPVGHLAFDVVIVGFNEFLACGDIQFSTDQLFEFSFDSELDLLLHPQWYRGWRRDWPAATANSASRRKYAIPTDIWGCCGVNGHLACECGQIIGKVSADCIGPHWMVLFNSRIERSDLVDGQWKIHDDAEHENQWIESQGILSSNSRTGEWESWLVTPRSEQVEKRDRNRNTITVEEEILERRLISTSQWDAGKLVAIVEE